MTKLLPLLLLVCLPGTVLAGSDLMQTVNDQHYNPRELKELIAATPRETINKLVDETGRTPLICAADNSFQQATLLLLLAGADPKARDHAGRTAAFGVVPYQGEDWQMILEMLLLAGADPGATDNEGISLLALAAKSGNPTAARLLLLRGADPKSEKVPANKTAMFFALENHDDKMTALLSGASLGEEGVPPTGGGPTRRFMAAAIAAKTPAINLNVLDKANINYVGETGETALHRAVREKRANAVAMLLLDGADPNIATEDGDTPLMSAACYYDLIGERMLFELILAGADIHAVTKDGSTALSRAVHSKANRAAEWLIWRGANVNVETPDGTLMQAARRNADWPSMIALLKRYNVPEDLRTPPDADPVIFDAVRRRKIDEVQAALDKDPRADVENRYGQTALEWAVCYDCFDIVDLLIRYGANINHVHPKSGWHILHTLGSRREENSTHTAKLIAEVLRRGGNPDVVIKDGTTPLMFAALAGDMGPKMDVLLKATNNVTARNGDHLTAVGIARKHGYTALVKMLLEKGLPE